jgi:hypothetical protein
MNLRRLLILVLAALAVSNAQAQQSVARLWNEQLLDAIRIDMPHPPKHARNLHHTAIAMYDAWAAYDPAAIGYLHNEKVSPLPGDIEAARAEAISYAAYRVLRARFTGSPGQSTALANFDNQLTALGYSTTFAQSAITHGTTPAEVGRRIGQLVLNYGNADGFSDINFPQPYDSSVNPNMNVPLPVLGTNAVSQSNMPLGYGIPAETNPNFWQPLSLSVSVTQNGIPITGGAQTFVGVQGLSTQAFSLQRTDNTKPWIDIGPPSTLGTSAGADAAYKAGALDVLRESARLNDNTEIDISPISTGNNSLGADNGQGYTSNPVPGGAPYTPQNVKVGDFTRVLAEYWADGPHSETPPGHWHVLANEVADMPGLQKRLRGTGPIVSDLEWDVKTYMALAGGVHDAACAAWSLKRYYSGPRPITMIRHLCSLGQSTSSALPNYHADGIPLEANVVELISADSVGTAQNPGRHYQIWSVATNSYLPGANFIDQIAVFSWPGEDPSNPAAPTGQPATAQSTVRWMLGKDWLPFQRKTFNTPAFPGYISGHSTFSRAAAEVMTLITGTPYFPGGFHHRTINANSLQIDLGPSETVDLQWASYYDAADQAGQSRRYGGIHPVEDDLPARVVGSQAGISAFLKAEKFWTGSIQSESPQPTVVFLPNGDAQITWTPITGRSYRLRSSTDFTNWTFLNKSAFAFNGNPVSFTHTSPALGSVYEIVELMPTSIARVWNEQLLQAIRVDNPHPPKHARNLHHLATVMYNAWAAYDSTAIGYIHHERATASGSIAEARKEAISYAAYRLLKARFAVGPGVIATNTALDAQMDALGYDRNITTTTGNTPAALGNRIANTIISWGLNDGSSEANDHADFNYWNPQPAMIVLGDSGAVGGIPEFTDPNRWQPLALSTFIQQNGIPFPGTVQPYIGVTWLDAIPFSLARTNPAALWIDPGPPSKLGGTTDAIYKAGGLELLIKSSQLNSEELINISPGAFGNNPLGTDDGTGHPVNPTTGQPYAPNIVKLGDFARVMAEFWADGPHSETPPGHWHVLANEVSDHTELEKRIGGSGPIVDDLEWDVKTYFALAAATHDAACACWSIKRYYEGQRPITMIRYMCSKGQSSDPGLPSYHAEGIPLMTGVSELITEQTALPGNKHENIWDIDIQAYVPGADHIGKVVVYSWPSEPGDPLTQTNTVRWMFGEDWLPYQRRTFNTPAFPGYTSGHSTFSRAAAEVLTALTGTAYVPGGIGSFVAQANSYLIFERGPSQTVALQWATWYDAADQAGQSRRWGGIHPAEDDYPAREIGSQAGKQAWALAQKYFTGDVLDEAIVPTQTWNPDGSITLSSTTRRGLYYLWEYSTDLQTWTPLTSSTQATTSSSTLTDTPPPGQRRFYRTRWVASM